MRILLLLFALAFSFCLIAVFLSAFAVGIGFILAKCKCVSGLQQGDVIIAGSIIASATLYFFCRLLNAAANYKDDDESIPDEHPVLVLPKDFLRRSPWSSKSKGKRK